MKLIKKEKLADEIEKRIKETKSMQPKFDQFWAGQISAFKGILKILDTLETKDVDFIKDIPLQCWQIPCADPNYPCENPQMDCINCPRFGHPQGTITITSSMDGIKEDK